jgi:hypothetical protein
LLPLAAAAALAGRGRGRTARVAAKKGATTVDTAAGEIKEKGKGVQHPSQKSKLKHPGMEKKQPPRGRAEIGPHQPQGPQRPPVQGPPRPPLRHPSQPNYAEVSDVPTGFQHPSMSAVEEALGPTLNPSMRREFAPGEIAGALASRRAPIAGALPAPEARPIRMPNEAPPVPGAVRAGAPDPQAMLENLNTPPELPPSAAAAAMRDRRMAQLAARPTDTGAEPIRGWEDMSDLSDKEMFKAQDIAGSLLARRQAGDYRRYVQGKKGVGDEMLPTNPEFMRTQDINDMLGIPVKMTRVAHELTEKAKKAKADKKMNLKREPIKTPPQPKAPSRRRPAEPKQTTAQRQAEAERLAKEPKQTPPKQQRAPKPDALPIAKQPEFKTLIDDRDKGRVTIELKEGFTFPSGKKFGVFNSRADARRAIADIKKQKATTSVAKAISGRKKLSIKGK